MNKETLVREMLESVVFGELTVDELHEELNWMSSNNFILDAYDEFVHKRRKYKVITVFLVLCCAFILCCKFNVLNEVTIWMMQ